MPIGWLNPQDAGNTVAARPAHVNTGVGERRWWRNNATDVVGTQLDAGNFNAIIAALRGVVDHYGIGDSEGDDTLLRQAIAGGIANLTGGETSVASAATADIGAAPTTRVSITGSAAITSFGTVPNKVRLVRFTGALALRHNATSLILPGSHRLNAAEAQMATIFTGVGDALVAASDGSGNWRVLSYLRASEGLGSPIKRSPFNRVLRDYVSVSPWLISTTPADNSWRTIIWVPEEGWFVAAANSGSGNRVMTSPDGITWTARTTPDHNWAAFAWSPELDRLVAVAETGTAGALVMTSPGGIIWTPRTSPAGDSTWFDVEWSPELGLFVAVAWSGSGDRVMTSPDGITWTSRPAAAANQWVSLVWAAELGLFVAVASSGAGNRVMTSPDGITWTIRTSAADLSWRRVCWSPELGLLVAVAWSGTGNRIMTSPDGITWTARTSAADNNWSSVCWSPELGLFCASAISGTGNRLMTSPDGITWTLRTSAADNSWYDIAWSPELGLFAAVAASGTGNRAMTSTSAFKYPYRS
jgi:hypothetical protein